MRHVLLIRHDWFPRGRGKYALVKKTKQWEKNEKLPSANNDYKCAHLEVENSMEGELIFNILIAYNSPKQKKYMLMECQGRKSSSKEKMHSWKFLAFKIDH